MKTGLTDYEAEELSRLAGSHEEMRIVGAERAARRDFVRRYEMRCLQRLLEWKGKKGR